MTDYKVFAKRTTFTLFALTAILVPSAANAAPILWTLNNVTLDNSGTASGTFQFDADTNTYSTWNITTSPATIFDFDGDSKVFGTTYTDANSTVLNYASLGFANDLDLQSAGAESELVLRFASSLTDAGGTIAVSTNSINFGQSGEYDLSGNTFADRLVTGGTVSASAGSATPEPSTVIMLGGGLVGLGVVKRRRNKQA
jgi:hypothetical protein